MPATVFYVSIVLLIFAAVLIVATIYRHRKR
jgi:hypothetical protein